jgi:hypothetical protein
MAFVPSRSVSEVNVTIEPPTDERTVLVVGSGNASHYQIARLGARKDLRVNWLAPIHFSQESRPPLQSTVRALMPTGPADEQMVGTDLGGEDGVVTGTAHTLSSDPAVVVPSADVILIPLPSFAMEKALALIEPFAKPGAIICALPGQGGFYWAASKVFGERARDFIFCATDVLPYNCRVTKYGEEVRLFGQKYLLGFASMPAKRNLHAAATVCDVLGKEFAPLLYPSQFCVTMFPSNQAIHPARMWGLFGDFEEGKSEPLPENPLFYETMDRRSANKISIVNDEIVDVTRRLAESKVWG